MGRAGTDMSHPLLLFYIEQKAARSFPMFIHAGCCFHCLYHAQKGMETSLDSYIYGNQHGCKNWLYFCHSCMGQTT